MRPDEVASKAREKLGELTDKRANMVTGVVREEGEWVVNVEVLERSGIPDTMDVLGEYEVRMSDQAELVSFTRVRLRKRGDMR